MKKILCLLTCCFVFGISANAATLTIDWVYSNDNNGFIVSGTSDDNKTGDEVTVEAYIAETVSGTTRLLDAKTALTYKDSDGKIKYKTDVIPIDYTVVSGEISFKAYAAHADSVTSQNKYLHYGISDAYTILKNLSQNLTQNDYDSFVQSVKNTSNATILGIDLSVLPQSTSAAYAATTGYLSTMTINVPSSLVSEDDYKKTSEELSKFRSECENLAMVSEFSACQSKTEFISWYTKYADKLKLSEVNAKKMGYFTDKYAKDKYFEILKKENMIISDINTIKTRILDVAGLTAVAEGNQSVVSTVITDFDDRMNGKRSVDIAVHTVVCGQLYGKTYSTFGKLVEAYNAAIPTDENQGTDNGYHGGGGGGSSMGMTYAPVQPVEKQIFSDMAKNHWARTAVEYLYDMGIINGRTDEEFAPEENITRAEFIKILVCVQNLKLVYGKTEFSDVAENDWYAPYINTAYQNNITSGYDDGTFKPNNNITREDMATMIFRTAGYEDSGIAPSFADAKEISAYAKSAVAILNQKGIINGVGENKFAPKASATRAQAAQIIYNWLMKN